MKLSEIFKFIQHLFSFIKKLPHTVVTWIATITTILCLASGFSWGKHKFENWQSEKRIDRIHDSIIINSVNQVNHRLSCIEYRFDSLGRMISASNSLNNQKFNSMATHIQGLENGNDKVIQDLNQLNKNFELFTSPFLNYLDQKKNLQTPLTSK